MFSTIILIMTLLFLAVVVSVGVWLWNRGRRPKKYLAKLGHLEALIEVKQVDYFFYEIYFKTGQHPRTYSATVNFANQKGHAPYLDEHPTFMHVDVLRPEVHLYDEGLNADFAEFVLVHILENYISDAIILVNSRKRGTRAMYNFLSSLYPIRTTRVQEGLAEYFIV